MKFFKLLFILFLILITNQLYADNNNSGVKSYLEAMKKMTCIEGDKSSCVGFFICNPIIWDDKSGGKESFALEFLEDKIVIKNPPFSGINYNLIYPDKNEALLNKKLYISKITGDIIKLEPFDNEVFYTVKNINKIKFTKILLTGNEIGIGTSTCKKLSK